MADDAGTQWQVYPPPAPDELRVRVEAGANVELDDDLRAAIQHLADLVARQSDPDEGGEVASRGALQVGKMDLQKVRPQPNYGGGEVMGDCFVNLCRKNSGFQTDPGAIRT